MHPHQEVTRDSREAMYLLLHTGQGGHIPSGVVADKIEWCGGEYDVADLKDALTVVMPSGTLNDQLLAQQYSDPWAPDTWTLLGPPAQSLLQDLAQSQAAFNTHVCATEVHCVIVVFPSSLLGWDRLSVVTSRKGSSHSFIFSAG